MKCIIKQKKEDLLLIILTEFFFRLEGVLIEELNITIKEKYFLMNCCL